MTAIALPGGEPTPIVTSRHYPRVVLIDDNAGDIELLSIAFEMCGIGALVTTASDGDQGMAMLRLMQDHHELPDLVLLDLNMPRHSGFEVLADMAALVEPLACPVVVWTSSSSMSDREMCLAKGAAAFYIKPERIGDYIKLVESLRGLLAGMRQ